MASSLGATVPQLAYAWVMAQGEDIVPLAGARTPEQVSDALAAPELELSADALAQLEAAVPPDGAAGERYAPPQMAHLDSER